jgi:hypothetical protein
VTPTNAAMQRNRHRPLLTEDDADDVVSGVDAPVFDVDFFTCPEKLSR